MANNFLSVRANYLDYSETNNFSETLIQYIRRDDRLISFIENWPTADGFRKQLNSKKEIPHRDLLVDVLLEQYGDIAIQHPTVKSAIETLGLSNTYTVTTGHQLNIFTGPLYFIFKIISTIKLADDLKKEHPDLHFVPIYWMATEDHDFEEINHTYLQNDMIKWDHPASGATGRLPVVSMARTVQRYLKRLGLSHHADKLTLLIQSAYLDQNNLADATRVLVNGLFHEFGLVIIDGDHPRFKRLFSSFIKRDILEENSYSEITKTSKKLEDSGFEAQAYAREINFFYLTDNRRERIVKRSDGQYEVLHQSVLFTKPQLEAEIEKHPEHFSPNVVMRPLYQEILLPNCCYVGGGAEIIYWLQLKSNFDFYGVPFPILLPRNSALIADEHLDYKIFRLNLTFKSLFKDAELLKKEYVRIHSKHRLNLNDEWLEMEQIFEKIKDRAAKIDPTLKPSAEAIKTRLKGALNNLEKKFVKADKNNFDTAILQIDQLHALTFPNGILQERIENFGMLYIKYGDQLFKELYKHFNPLDQKFTILY